MGKVVRALVLLVATCCLSCSVVGVAYAAPTTEVSFSSSLEVVGMSAPVPCTFSVLSHDEASGTGTVQVGDGAQAAIPLLTSGYPRIPNEVDHAGVTYRVVAVGERAFEGCGGLQTTGLAFNTSIERLGNRAWADCVSLHSAELGENNTVASVGVSCFEGCVALVDTGLDANTSVVTLGERTFARCYNLSTTGLVANTSISQVPAGCYYQCYGLVNTGFATNRTVVSVGEDAFRECRNLITSDFTTNETVRTVGARAFMDGTRIIDTGLLVNHTVEEVGASAFEGCVSLQWIAIPETLRTVGDRAFAGCVSARSVTVVGDAPSVLGAECFSGIGPGAVLSCEVSQVERWNELVAGNNPAITVIPYGVQPDPTPDPDPDPDPAPSPEPLPNSEPSANNETTPVLPVAEPVAQTRTLAATGDRAPGLLLATAACAVAVLGLAWRRLQ